MKKKQRQVNSDVTDWRCCDLRGEWVCTVSCCENGARVDQNTATDEAWIQRSSLQIAYSGDVISGTT